MLPAGWKEQKVEKLCSLINGNGFKPRDWDTKGLPIIRIQNLNGSENFNYYSKTPEPEWIVNHGELLFAWAGTKGVSFGPCIWKGEKGVLNQHIYKVNPQTGVCKEWLFLILDRITKNIESRAHGFKSTLVHVHKKDIIGQTAQVPPLAEQKKIAEILSTWDEAISVVNKQLENCRLQKKALMQKLLTGRKRLPGFSGEWKAKRLSSFCKRITERNNGHCSLVATISAQYGLIRQEEFFNKSVASETLDNYFLLRKGDFAYNKSYSLGYPMGAIKRLNRYHEAVVTSLYICFRLDETKADSNYFEFFFDSGLLDKSLTQIAAEGGRAHGLLNVRPDDFMGIQILFPPLEEQKAISNVLSTSARQIEMLEQKLQALQEEKKSLMQQLLTGKKRVAV